MKKSEEDRLNVTCLERVVSGYNRYFQNKLGFAPESKKKGKKHKGHYHFIPSTCSGNILNYLRIAKDHINKKRKSSAYSLGLNFLDCGCGIGNIMLLANAVGGFNRIAGIEYDLATYKVAKELMEHYTVIRGDLTNFPNYADYDILYYYEPISDGDKKLLFFEKMENDMEIGAVIISNGGSMYFESNRRFKRLQIVRSGRTVPIYEKVRM